MNFFAWVLVSFFVLDGLVSVAYVGKPRQTLTAAGAVFYLIVCWMLVLVVVLAVAS